MGSVVITGMAATASLGTNVDAIWRRIQEGRCGVGPMPTIESSVPTDATGGEAHPLPDAYQPDLPREARYLRWTIEQAILSAELVKNQFYRPTRRCVILGTTLQGIRAGGRFLRTNKSAELESFLAGSICAQAIDGLNFRGGALTTCSACSSSLSAITMGVTLLESHQVDLVIAGGYDTISEYAWAGFNSLRLIASDVVRPFCRDRDGMKVAEGYGLVVLERWESARDRGAPIRTSLAGWGESADSYHLTKPHPHGDGALAAIRASLHRAGISASDVDMIAAHATGTPDNDASEYRAFSRLLGSDLPHVPVIGFKSFLGHTLGGAGAVEVVLSCKAIQDQCVPATPGVAADEIEYDDLNLSVGTTTNAKLRITLNTSLGFGGANECLIMTTPALPTPTNGRTGRRISPACITGIGIVLPNAIGNAEFVSVMTLQDGTPTQDPSSDIDEQELLSHIQTRRVRRLSLSAKLTLAAATMAIRDASIAANSEALANACAIIGTTHGPIQYCYDYYNQIVNDGAMAANPMLFAEGVPNAASAHLSTTFGIKGSCQTIIGSMTAGLDALALAALRISTGATERVLVVASEEASPHTDRAYSDRPCDVSLDSGSVVHGSSISASVAILLEAPAVAASRGVAPYASITESAWACSPSVQQGGPAGSIASVLRRLHSSGPVLRSNHRSWLQRAELLGIRRAGGLCGGCPVACYSGNLFAVAPLVNLASTLIDGPNTPNRTFTSLDITGASTAVCIEQGSRYLA